MPNINHIFVAQTHLYIYIYIYIYQGLWPTIARINVLTKEEELNHTVQMSAFKLVY
ncbi:MAG: hypothetical protein MCS20_01980 [Candidatus Phytoplasma mali]|nr:hypothetical protein [Candidatus Phytoplasma australiense]MCG7202159.1 hypothetical protein [Candidatus Phytoplasma mali]